MLNECQFIGNLGNDPEVKTMQSGDKVANLSVGVSESWKDKKTGERKNKTEWVRCTVFGPLVSVVENYLQKGSKIYIKGQMETRSWEDQSGAKKYSTEIVLRGFNSKLVMLDGKQTDQADSAHNKAKADGYAPQADIEEDEIPF